MIDLYVVGPRGQAVIEPAQIDTAADHTLLAVRVAAGLGRSLPFPRRATVSGLGGLQVATASFPPDGLFSLFVTDYRDYAYLARPLVGFHSPGRLPASQRSVLGLTGFLQYFHFTLDLTAAPPVLELQAGAGFPGAVGALPRDRSLADFLADLRA